ncbi:hypothetical protein FQN60_012564, partial [Etheostoma spectabile]
MTPCLWLMLPKRKMWLIIRLFKNGELYVPSKTRSIKNFVSGSGEEVTFQAIEARRQRLSACEEPSDGVFIKFKYPNGHINMRKFSLLEPIQILFDFVGQDDIASEIFVVQEATSPRSIESTSSGKFCRINKMMELVPYTIHLIVSHRCVRLPPSQVSLYSLFSHCCVRPSPSLISLCPLFSHCCPMLFDASSSPSIFESSSQPLLTLFSEPQEILTLHEPSLPPSSAQESIIILDEKDETIQEATTVQDANSAIAEAADSLSIIGALRHVSSLQEKDSLSQSAADFFVNGRLATALE